MTKEMRKFLHDVIASILGLQGNRVLWRNQDGFKLENPVVTLFVYSQQGQAMPDFMPVDAKGNAELKVPTDAVLEVQMFDKKGEFPADKLETLVRKLETPEIVDLCFNAGVAFFNAEAVQDMTDLLPNSQQYEPRAAVDLHFRYTEVTEAQVGIIETVNVDGETDGRQLVFSVSASDE